MAATYLSRLVQVNQVIIDQVDIFQSDFYNRVTGLVPANVTLTLFFNNQAVAWPLSDGTGIVDSQIASGTVYWNELPNSSYGVRFFPNALGHWNLVIQFAPSPSQIISISYDVVNMPSLVESGLQVNFC